MKKKKKRKAELKQILEKYKGSLEWLEEGELRSWVEAGNSPYTNPEGIMHKDGILFDFIEWHRSARWITEEIPLSQPTYFDYICSCAESEYSPHSKKLDSEKFLLIVECLNYPNPTITAILILVKQNS